MSIRRVGVLLVDTLFNSFFFFPRIFRLLHVKYADVLFCNCSYSVHNVTEVTAEFLDEKKINPYCQ